MRIAPISFVLSLTCAALITSAAEAPRDVLAHGSGESFWICRVLADAQRQDALYTLVHARFSGADTPRLIAKISAPVVEMTNRASQLVVLLDNGHWQMIWPGGSASGAALPGNARIIAISGERDRLWAVGIVPGGIHALPKAASTTRPATRSATQPVTQPTTHPTTLPEAHSAAHLTTRPATHPTTLSATQPATAPLLPRLVLFHLSQGNRWEACAELPREMNVDSPHRIAMTVQNPEQPLIAVEVGNVLRVQRLMRDRTWKDLGRVPGEEDIVEFDWVNGMPRPTLWIAGPSGPGTLYIKEGGTWRQLNLEVSAPISAGEHRAITVASERIRLLFTNDGKVFEQRFEIDGVPFDAPAELALATPSSDVGFVHWINMLAMVSLMLAMLASLRRRKLMNAEFLESNAVVLAPMGMRLAAGMIDAAPALVGMFILGRREDLAELTASNELSIRDLMPLWIGLAIYVLHTSLTEMVWGRTLGKQIFGMKVITVEGSKPGAGAILARNFLRLAEFPIAPVVLAMMLYSPLRQRAGDIAAATVVVMNEKPDSESEADGETPPDSGDSK